MAKLLVIKQRRKYDCGLTCLLMIARFYGKNINYQRLKKICPESDLGISLYDLNETSKKLGFNTLMIEMPFEKIYDVPLPLIAYINNNHFVVVYKVTKNKIYLADPALNNVIYFHKKFISMWVTNVKGSSRQGAVLLLEPLSK